MGTLDAVATVQGRLVSLRPVSREDYPAFFAWRSNFETVHPLNAKRRITTFEEFVREFEAMLPQSIVFVVMANGRRIGYALGYSVNPWDRWMGVGMYVEPRYRALGQGGEAALLAIDLMFRLYPVDKLIAEVYEFAEDLKRMMGVMGFEEAGFIPEHYWHEDQRWGLHYLMLTRDRWQDARQRFGDIMAVERMAEDRAASNVGGNGASAGTGGDS